MLADRSAQEAKRQEAEARRQQSEAERQRERSEYESYVSRIYLVKARIEQNEFDDARRVLEDLRRERGDQGLGWEWRWLSRLTRRATDSLASDDAVSDLAISPSGSKGIAVLDNGTVRSATVLPSRGLAWTETEYANLASLRNVVAVAISGDDSRVAVALAGGDIEIWDDRFGDRVAVCQGHQATARTLRFTDSGLLVSGSDDRTARLWDTASGKELATCWHLGPVKDVAVSGRGDGLQVVAAVAEAATGYAEVWTLRPPTGDAETPWRSESLGSFRGHVAPVLAVAASPDGRMVASGDAQGRCFLWRPDQVDSIDYRSAIASAIKRVSGDDSAAIDTDGDQRSVEDLSSPDLGTADERFLVELSDRSAGRAALGPSSSGSSSIGAEGAGADPASVSPPAHRDAIRSIAFHPDGQTIVTASDDYTLGLWDRSTVRMIDSLRGHGGSVRGVSFLGRAVDNGPLRVVSASSDKTIKTWVESSPHRQDLSAGLAAGQSPQTGLPASEAARQATRLRLHDDAITSVRFDPTGQRIVTTSIDQTAKVLRFDPGSQTFQPEMLLSETVDPETLAEGSSFLALSLAIDRANRRLFIGSADAVVRVWDWEQATEIGRIEATGLNESLALTADGRFLLTGSSSPEISAVLWRVETLTPFEARKVNEFAGHTQAVTAFSVSPDGRFVFTGDRGGIGYLWDRETGGQIGDRLEQVRGYRINVATFTADGSQILIAADDQNLSRIDLSTRQIVSRFAHDGPVVGIGLSPDGRRVATVSERSESGRLVTAATLWDTQSGEKKSLGTAASSRSTGSPDGSSDGRADMPVPSDPFGRIVTADFSPNGSTLVVGYETGEEKRGELRIWDAGSVQRARNVGGFRLPESVGPVTAAAAITDDQLITLDGDSAFWWDLATQSHVRSFAANGSLARASFSADGQSIATVSQGVKIWDVAAGRSVIKVELPHAGPVYAAEFSPAAGSTLFATAGDDGLVKLWNWNAADRSVDKVRQWELAGPKTAIRRLAFSDDGARLAAVGDRGVIRVLSTDSPTVWNYDLGRPDQPFADALTSVAISRGGQWLAVGGTDAKGRIWRLPPVGVEATSDTVSAGETVVPILLQGHADRIEDIRFLEDGTSQIRVLTASRDKSARVWDPQIGSPQAVAREILMLRGHAFGVTGIDVDPDHQTVVTSGTDGQVILWPADPVASRAEGLDN
jgi:WD40 repeat protein